LNEPSQRPSHFGAHILGILDADANERGDRNMLPGNGFANWRGAHSRQLDFSLPIIAIFGTALVGRAWKTRSTTNEWGPEFNAFWIPARSKFHYALPKMPVAGH
jgi:hypothetical protein